MFLFRRHPQLRTSRWSIVVQSLSSIGILGAAKSVQGQIWPPSVASNGFKWTKCIHIHMVPEKWPVLKAYHHWHVRSGVGKCTSLGVWFTSPSVVFDGDYIPNSWVMSKIRTFTNPCWSFFGALFSWWKAGRAVMACHLFTIGFVHVRWPFCLFFGLHKTILLEYMSRYYYFFLCSIYVY